MLTIKKTTSYFLGSLMCALTACTLSKTVETEIDRNLEKIQTSITNASPEETQMSLDTITVKDDIWLGNQSSRIKDGDPLPARFETDNGITLVSTKPVSLLMLTEQLTSMTGITVRIDERVREKNDKLLQTVENVNEDAETPENMILPMYEGKLSGFLDQICARFNLWWRYKNNEIIFYQMETRMFTFYALPTTSSLSATIGGTSSGADGGSTSTSLSSDIQTDFWTEIEEAITAMIPEDASMTTSATNGTITVTASPYTLQRVAQYVRNMNEKLSRQVAISVKILQVTLSDTEQMGLNMNLVTSALSARIGFDLATTAAVTAASGATDSLTMNLVQPNQNGQWINNSSIWKDLWKKNYVWDADSKTWVLDSENPYSASSAVIDAISKQGATSLITSATVTTLNNKVAPVQVSTETTYISSSETTVNNGVTTISQSTDTVNAGFTMEVLPRILDHGRLLLMFTMTITDLTQLEPVTSGNSTLMLPTVETRGFVQEVAMTSGSTLVLTGFEKVKSANTDTKGISGKRNEASKDRNVLVVLLTPQVLISPLSPESRMQN